MDGKIIVTTTGIRITPYHMHQCPQIESSTSKYDKVTHRRIPITGFFLLDENSFITHHMDTKYLEKVMLNRYEIIYQKPIRPKRLSRPLTLHKSISPKDVQTDIITKVVNDNKNNQWFIYLSQGLGKTLLSVMLMSYFNVKSFIMCYNADILQQWIEVISDKTDIEKGKLLLITSSKLITKILDEKFDYEKFDFFLCTPMLLTKYGNKHGFDKIDKLMKKIGIGVKIFDEAHRNVANIVHINAFTSIGKTIYLSGDFGQSDPIKENMYFKMFYGVPILKPDQEVMNTLKFTNAVVIEYDSKPTELEIASTYKRRGVSFFDYMKYQFTKDIFFDVVFGIIDKITGADEAASGFKVLILVNLVEHVDTLHSMLVSKYGTMWNIGRFHSEVSIEEKERCKKECNMIVSTYQSFSTGLDVSLIKYIISCSICTKIDDNQSSGRARPLPDGSDAYYFMLADRGLPYTKKKLNQRLLYLNATKIKKISKVKFIQ